MHKIASFMPPASFACTAINHGIRLVYLKIRPGSLPVVIRKCGLLQEDRALMEMLSEFAAGSDGSAREDRPAEQ